MTDTYQISPEWGSVSAPLLRKLESQNGNADDALKALHQFAQSQFQQAPLPNRKQEDWKYTPLRELLKTEFATADAPQDISDISQIVRRLDATNMVFVNGHYMPQLSDPMPEGIHIAALDEAAQDEEATRLIKLIVAQLETCTMNPFEALTTSLTSPGIVIVAKANTKPDRPLHVIHINDRSEEAAGAVYPYKMYGIGRNAEVHLMESFIAPGSGVVFTNSVNHIHVDSGAQFSHYRLQEENKQSFHVNSNRIFQEQDSVYTSLAVELGAKLMRNTIEVIHRGSGVLSNLLGLFMATERQHSDTQSFIDHALPYCESHELYKGILDGYARGVFNGKIIVRPDAQKTNAFQQNSTLLLSRDAIMDSKPQLEIFADDVKCSHGATIGQLDEEAVFYLRSRGLSKQQASAMLQRAFVGEVLDRCSHEAIRNYLNQRVESYHHV